MKVQEDQQEPTLMKVLLQRFREAGRRKELPGMVRIPLTLYLTDKEDRNLCYLTDGNHTILAISPKKVEQINCHPYNCFKKPFYMGGAKLHLFLNWTSDPQPLERDQEHPYNPHFHFREDDFSQFQERRQKYRLSNPCETYHLLEYEIVLVNIQKTGYYGPALVLHNFKTSKSRNPPNYLNLNCILYEPVIQQTMQKYRLDDIREHIAVKHSHIKRGSLFFIARRETLNEGKTTTSHVVAIDWEKEILEHNHQRPYTFVLASDFQENAGPCGVANPKLEAVERSIQMNIHRQQLEQILNNLRLDDAFDNDVIVAEDPKFYSQKDDETKMEHIRPNRKAELWSDSESEQQQIPQTPQKMVGQIPSDSDSDDGPDPLKQLYTKLLQKINKQL